MSACRSCGAEVAWAVTSNGKPIPLDPRPVEDGNLAVMRGPKGELTARVITDAAPLMPDLEHRGRSHFATCPNADAHRKERT